MSRKIKTTSTKEDAKPALVPKLRFPEFRNDGEWETKRLSDEIELLSGMHLSPDQYGTTGEAPYFTGPSDFTNEIKSVSKWTKRTENLAGPDDTLITVKGSGVGEVWYLTLPAVAMGRQLMAVRSRHGSGRFIFQFLLTKKTRFEDLGAGNLIPGLARPDILEMEAYFPSPSEQHRIASCLSSVDELIAAQARKVDAIKSHKKGLMQQLFPREGETQPRLRFPEFQNDGEWVEDALGSKTIKVGSGITPTGGDKNYKQEGLPFVRSQNVGWGVLLLDDIAYIDEETHAAFDSTEIKERDVLLNITGASIGRSAVADERVAGGNVNQHVCIIRTKLDELNPFFLNQYLISQRGQKQIDSFQAGGNRQGLNFAQIRTFSIPLPPEILEQNRIASCISSLDALITSETQKLDALKRHKRGLMQQLFPSSEANS